MYACQGAKAARPIIFIYFVFRNFRNNIIFNQSNPTNRILYPTYQKGRGPVDIRIYDPMKVKAGNFTLAFAGNTAADHWQLYSKCLLWLSVKCFA